MRKTNPAVSVRKPEATNFGRILGFREKEVALFLKNVEEFMPKYKFPPTRVCNIDDTGILAVQEPGLILTPKGQKRVSFITRLERGKEGIAHFAL